MDKYSRYAEVVFTNFIKDYVGPNASGECDARVPFKFCSGDSKPSFRFNLSTGAWKDFKHNLGGGLLQFVAYMNNNAEDDKLDLVSAKHEIEVMCGVIKVNPNWYKYQATFLELNPEIIAESKKPWKSSTCIELGIGYCNKQKRFTIPIFTPTAKYVKSAMYGCVIPKVIWKETGVSGNYLFPHFDQQYYVLVEGMPDAISLRSFGFPGVSGILGAGSPLPPGHWYTDKRIYVLMDADASGYEAEKKILSLLNYEKCDVFVCKLPDWVGRSKTADISDYIVYLMIDKNFTEVQIKQSIQKILDDSERVYDHEAEKSREPRFEEYFEILDSKNIGLNCKFRGKVEATSQTYGLVKKLTAVCPTTGHKGCAKCAMKLRFNGNAIIKLDHTKRDTISYIQNNNEQVMLSVKQALDINRRCEDLKMETADFCDAEIVVIGPPKFDSSIRHKIEVFYPGRLDMNKNYEIQGYVYGHPETQKLMFLAKSVECLSGDYDKYVLTKDEFDELSQFIPTRSIWEQLSYNMEDLSLSCTGIYGRSDLHLAYSIAFFSPISFYFSGKMVPKGWVDMLVLGDTRCGKSHTYRSMSELYDVGNFVDCKNTTTVGMIGAVETSSVTGERYVIPGALPQNDKGLVFLDEFRNFNNGGNLLADISSVRSEGFVTITKAASATFPARVRLIFAANPGTGVLLSQTGKFGCELIHKIIPQPEDVARFTYAIIVSQDDVDPDIINKNTELVSSPISAESRQKLLRWAWSRKPEEILWDEGVEEIIIKYAKAFCSVYSPSIYLVEIAEQRIKIAKMAISIAMQLFSTTNGIEVIVKKEHAEAAALSLSLFFNKPAMAYDKYSEDARKRDYIDTDALVKLLERAFTDGYLEFCDMVLRNSNFSERLFVQMCNVNSVTAVQVFSSLIKLRCLTPSREKEIWVCSKQFIKFLKEISDKNDAIDKDSNTEED